MKAEDGELITRRKILVEVSWRSRAVLRLCGIQAVRACTCTLSGINAICHQSVAFQPQIAIKVNVAQP
jgi:hypothetical protein